MVVAVSPPERAELVPQAKPDWVASAPPVFVVVPFRVAVVVVMLVLVLHSPSSLHDVAWQETGQFLPDAVRVASLGKTLRHVGKILANLCGFNVLSPKP